MDVKMPVPVMEPVRVEVPRPRSGWSVEVKWDGVRLLAHRDGGEIRFYGRSGREYTPGLGNLAARVLAAVGPREAVLDGELVAWAHEGPSFPDAVRALRGGRGQRITYEVFDLIGEDGSDLRALPWEARRRRIESCLDPGPVVHPTRVFPGEQAIEVYRAVEKLQLEGVVMKDRDSPYVGGKSRYWEKAKHDAEGVFRVGSWRRTPGGATLHLLDAGGRPVGAVSSGVDADHITRLRALTGGQGGALPPGVEARVRFHGRTAAGRLRHPRLMGLLPQ